VVTEREQKPGRGEPTDTVPGTARTQLAVAGARAAVGSVFGKRPLGDQIANILFLALLMLGLGVALLGVAMLVVWSFIEGAPRFSLDLFTEGPSTLRPETAGFRPAILGSIYVILGVIALIVPLGVGAAIYLEEYADNTRWWNRLIELNIQNLAGVPSIVFGILGLAFIVRGPLDLGFVAMAGSMTLALLVLPTVIIAAREAIRAVPQAIREGALALGATRWQTVSRQVLPASISGILTGVILAVARAIGEAAPLLLVGAVTFVQFNPNFFDGGYTTLPTQIYNYARRPQEEFHYLAAAGVLIMILLVLVMNSFAIWLRNRFEQKW
jgi:phosphate transport system permease protein